MFRAIELISSLLMTHEMDERLNDNNAWLKSKLTLLYLPLITIIMDARSSLHDPFGQRSAASNASSSQSSGRLLDPKVAGSIAGLDRLPIEHNAVAGLSKMHLKQSGTLSKQLTKEVHFYDTFTSLPYDVINSVICFSYLPASVGF
jgi:hypothetical protein